MYVELLLDCVYMYIIWRELSRLLEKFSRSKDIYILKRF